jgi:protein farnesyltransferase/geranylgeranyltransferase type-1 subunit alpha
MRWARNFAESNPKNYQIWHHRLALVVLAPHQASEELQRTLIDLESSPKNYHAWQYRQWLLKSYGGSLQDELELIHELLRLDPYNNSAWNHRHFVLFSAVFPLAKDEAWWESELAFVNAKLSIDETNTSLHLYLQAAKAIHNKR